MDILFTLRHLLTSGHRNGHGVHSPSMYDFFTKVLYTSEKFDYSPAELSLVRLRSSNQKIMATSAGAKGNGQKRERLVSDIAKSSSSYGKYGQLLQRMSAYLKPASILELGTSLGIGTLYLASGNPEANVITVEACPETSKVASENFRMLGFDQITSIVSPFDDVLKDVLDNNKPFGLVYVDGNHTYDATIKYYKMIAEHAAGRTVAIFDDINWSRGMSKAWDEIKKMPASIAAVETMRMGIIFFDTNFTPKIYSARF